MTHICELRFEKDIELINKYAEILLEYGSRMPLDQKNKMVHWISDISQEMVIYMNYPDECCCDEEESDE